MRQIYLASASIRRLSLLQQIGISPVVLASTFAEPEVSQGDPRSIAMEYALEKARGALPVPPGGIVIGADTIVHLDGELFGKPRDEKHAVEILQRLSGRVHRVVTGLAIVQNGGGCLVDSEETEVKFRLLTEQEVCRYAATGEPLDKAGAYGIQGRGIVLVEHIVGCYTNVVGLPLTKLHFLLGQWGLDLMANWG
ncbi:MAG: Maf-like protein YhdE [Firmicutes bacterium]|nr:Maf-like protein YhdE [Bacillota bacterium]MBT9157362.1 Maf-like protein YhdE [Bacillota bacterium]